jgi:ribosomal protein S18 acetylase RimI-like enzyme
MKKKIKRFFLELSSLNDLIKSKIVYKNLIIILEKNKNFDFYKFLYKEIGKNFFWRDRLGWTLEQWNSYIQQSNLQFYVLKQNENLLGYYELLFDANTNSVEIPYLGIFKDYYGKGFGGYLLTDAIRQAFKAPINKVWVHTCTLDHPNALRNYISRGMKIFKTEEIFFDPQNL